jgi:hypothetical protein
MLSLEDMEVFFMAKQGCVLTEQEVQRIVELLATTDLNLEILAQRMGCSKSAVSSINRRYQVRIYGGCRQRWANAYETVSTMEFTASSNNG